MIWGLLKRIATFGTPVKGPEWITVSVAYRWPQVERVRVQRPTAVLSAHWPQAVKVRVDL